MTKMSGGNCRLFKVVEMPYWRQQSFDDSLIFAKCIDNQHFLISVLPSSLLMCLEGKCWQSSISSQHFTLQWISKSAFLPRPNECYLFSIATVCGLDPTHVSINWSDEILHRRLPVGMDATPFKIQVLARDLNLKNKLASVSKLQSASSLSQRGIICDSSPPLPWSLPAPSLSCPYHALTIWNGSWIDEKVMCSIETGLM